MQEGESYIVSDGTEIRVRDIIPNDAGDVTQDLVEFCLIADALKRKGWQRIIAIVPWLGYSKQDKVFRPGEPLSVKIIAKMIQVAPIDRMISFDLHKTPSKPQSFHPVHHNSVSRLVSRL